MKSEITTAAAAMLVAGVVGYTVTTSDPAIAKVTIACKNPVEAGGQKMANEYEAKSVANSKWQQAVKNKYGPYWASLSKAKYKHYKCMDRGSYWYCRLVARPCGQVTRPSASAFPTISAF